MTVHIASLIHDKLHNDLWQNDRSFWAVFYFVFLSTVWPGDTPANIVIYHLKFIPQVLIYVCHDDQATPNLHKISSLAAHTQRSANGSEWAHDL